MILSTAYFPPVEYFAILARYSVVYLEAHENYVKQSYRNRCRILTANGVEDLRFPIVHDGAKLITEVKVDYKTPWVRQTEYAIDSAYYSSPFFEYYRDSLFAILDSHPETLWELNGRITAYFLAKTGLSTEIRSTSAFGVPATAGSCPGVASASLHPSQADAWPPPVYETTGGHGPAVDTPSRADCCGQGVVSSGPLPLRGPLPLPGGGIGSCNGNCLMPSGAKLPDPVSQSGTADQWLREDMREAIHPKREPVMRNSEYWQVFKEKFGFVPNLSVMDLLFNEGPESICYLR